MPKLDLTQTALIIQAANGAAKEALRLRQNEPYHIYSDINITVGGEPVDIDPESRECTPAVPSAESELHLRFDSEMKDPSKGWTFGINSAQQKMCDILLGARGDVRRSGKKISAKHFRIYFNFQSGILVLQNESQHGTSLHIKGENLGEIRLKGRVGQSLDPTKVTEVTVADLNLLLYHPTLSDVQKLQHQENWQAFAARCKSAIPGLSQLALSSSASTRPPSQRAGLRNGYSMYDEIGRGEFGVVRRAIQYRSGAVYAAKEFFRVKSKQEAQNFSEIATLQRLSHPHIVEFVDVIVDQAGVALIMDFMPLGNLRDQHRRKRLSRNELKITIQQVLAAIAYLHGIKLVHRDIKPENILLKEWDPPIVKISDFGLATRDGFLTTECGTRKYAAPEVYISQYDKSVDIWSTGITALSIAQGLPDEEDGFVYGDWAAEVQKIVAAAHKERGDPFLELLREMLHINPKARPSAEACVSDPRLALSLGDSQFEFDQRNHDAWEDLPTVMFSPTSVIRDIRGSEAPTNQRRFRNNARPEQEAVVDTTADATAKVIQGEFVPSTLDEQLFAQLPPVVPLDYTIPEDICIWSRNCQLSGVPIANEALCEPPEALLLAPNHPPQQHDGKVLGKRTRGQDSTIHKASPTSNEELGMIQLEMWVNRDRSKDPPRAINLTKICWALHFSRDIMRAYLKKGRCISYVMKSGRGSVKQGTYVSLPSAIAFIEKYRPDLKELLDNLKRINDAID